MSMKKHNVNLNRVLDVREVSRNSIGGYPILAETQEWPVCKMCNARQVLFLQLDILKEFYLPFASGSHLSVFMCPNHNDIPTLYNDRQVLPANYWDDNEGHYKLILNPPIKREWALNLEPHLVYYSLGFKEAEESIISDNLFQGECYEIGSSGWKVGGVPSWIQDPEYPYCACGAEMRFVCQIPEDFGFEKAPDAESQPDSFSHDHYCLFLGNEVYIFACVNQCNPLAVIAAVQN